jgi:hypothetical protein
MKLNNVLKIGLVLAGAMALGGSKAKATTYFEDFNNPQFSEWHLTGDVSVYNFKGEKVLRLNSSSRAISPPIEVKNNLPFKIDYDFYLEPDEQRPFAAMLAIQFSKNGLDNLFDAVYFGHDSFPDKNLADWYVLQVQDSQGNRLSDIIWFGKNLSNNWVDSYLSEKWMHTSFEYNINSVNLNIFDGRGESGNLLYSKIYGLDFMDFNGTWGFVLKESSNPLSYVDNLSFSQIPVENDPPVADAGDDIIADANEIVTLDGSGSSDPDGQIIKYTWKRLPDNVVIYSGTEPTCKTKALGRVEEVIELTVTDNSMATATDTVKIISRTTQDLKDQLAALQSQIEQLQQQSQETRDLVDRICAWPPIRNWLKRAIRLGDLNHDGKVNMSDFALLAKDWLH